MPPFRSGRAAPWSALVSLLSILILVCSQSLWAAGKGEGKGTRKKKRDLAAMASASPGEQNLTNIPLPIGHEAKGLVLPDFDLNGHLRGKFEAGTARRLDPEHVRFTSFNTTTFTEGNQTDLTIEMKESVLDLKTRILSSNDRTTVRRADFNMVGDSVEFN